MFSLTLKSTTRCILPHLAVALHFIELGRMLHRLQPFDSGAQVEQQDHMAVKVVADVEQSMWGVTAGREEGGCCETRSIVQATMLTTAEGKKGDGSTKMAVAVVADESGL
ncbi:hypothetical protein B296_00000176 [Ensete ventricosum]|uniref:Uncharacterized protein n=1 Tax=Ensete ventricosum TaxID=4639 RepID=A0A426YET8_ENSVE|nr:hypothetical protein B296_00000176 [Ensete ventricosum]